MSVLFPPEPKAATILAFRPRAAAVQILASDHQPGLAAFREAETLNRPGLVLREICCAAAAPVVFILVLRSVLTL
jgi:hypothetical protein